MTRLLQHLRSLWPRWTFLPPIPFVAFAALMAARGDWHWDYAILALLVTVLAYYDARTKAFFVGAYPIALTGLLYGGMRYIEDLGVTAERVHDCDLRAVELRFFGVTVHGQRMTLQDFFQAHRSAALDVYFAIPYGTFLLACVLCAWVLYLRDAAAMQRFTWGFLLLNVAAFVTYHLYPAAPPWYFHAYGCRVDLSAAARPGPSLANVDALIHVGFFHGMYGRASDVFGAMPSLHAAYPLLILIEGWRHFRAAGRGLALVFMPSMWLAAVYLDHHWVIDIVVGVIYCAVTAAVIRRASWLWRSAPEPGPSEVSETL